MKMKQRRLLSVLQTLPVEQRAIPMIGGLDEVTPPMSRKSGTVRRAKNFEQDTEGGYRRIRGYERFDGRSAPSDASYSTLDYTLTGTISVGNTVTGADSSATGVVIAITSTQLILTKVSGTFQAETLNVSGNPQGTAGGAQTLSGASTALLHATYLNAAADNYRSDIAAPTGSGDILGGFYLNNVNYCFRNNAGATAAGLFKSTGSGWSAVSLGRQVSFTSGGTTAIVEGNTVTGAASSATGVVARVVVTSGTWAGGDAAGKLILSSQTGTFQAENLNVGAVTDLATIASNSSAITLSPSGRYETVKKNFGGGTSTSRIYGCDGVNKGFEFDGTTYVPIDTGMTTDTPNHVTAHKNQLFFSFAGGSVQHSGLTTVSGTTTRFGPYQWSPVVGAAELAVGDEVSGFAPQPGSVDGGALAIFTRNRAMILYGSSSSDWKLDQYREEVGAYAHTIQDVGFTIFLDDRGITDLRTSQAYGNFGHAVLSQRVSYTVGSYRTLSVASCISRDRSQYRLFFTNDTGLYITVNKGKVVGIMPVAWGDSVKCCWTSEKNDGTEVMFFGSDDGMVYQMDKGTSFDGDDIEYYLNLSYDWQGSPMVEKSYNEMMIEVQPDGYAAFNVGTSIVSHTETFAQSVSVTAWGGNYYSDVAMSPDIIPLDGSGYGLSVSIEGQSDIQKTFGISAAIYEYIPRRRLGGFVALNDALADPSVSAPVLSGQAVGSVEWGGGTPTVTTDKSGGTLYMVIVPNGDVPTTIQIKNGLQSSGAAALASEAIAVGSSGAQTFSEFGDLDSSTAYDAWFVHTDAWLNNSTAVKADFTTTAYACDAADFDGTNDYLARGADLTGAADSKKFTAVFWVLTDAVDTFILSGVSGIPSVYIGDPVEYGLYVEANDASGTTALTAYRLSTDFSAWKCVMLSFDMSDTAKRHLYINDSGSITVGSYVNTTLDQTRSNWSVGAASTGGQKLNGGLADLMYWPGQYIDLSVEANRRLFYSASGKPVNPYQAIQTLGRPIVRLHMDDGEAAANFALNRGTGGDFVVNGSLSTRGTSPSD